jgi:hypothetical protein
LFGQFSPSPQTAAQPPEELLKGWAEREDWQRINERIGAYGPYVMLEYEDGTDRYSDRVRMIGTPRYVYVLKASRESLWVQPFMDSLTITE